MPQKIYEGVFSHVIAFSFLFEMPQNRMIEFSIPHFLCSKYLPFNASYYLFDFKSGENRTFQIFPSNKSGAFRIKIT